MRALLQEHNNVMLDRLLLQPSAELQSVKILIAVMRAILIATGITPPAPESERKVLLILVLILLGLALGTWLVFKFLVPLMA